MEDPVRARPSREPELSHRTAWIDAVLVVAFSMAALVAAVRLEAFEWLASALGARGNLDEIVIALLVMGIGAIVFAARRWIELRRLTAELRDRECRLRMVTEQIPALVWTTDSRLHFTSMLGSGLRALGIDAAAALGQPLSAYVDGAAHPAMVAHQRALGGLPNRYTMDFGGRVLACHVEPLTGANGERLGVTGVALDETLRSRAEAALLQAEAHHRRLVEHSPYGIYVTDADRCCVEANEAMLRILGRTHDEMLGRSFFDVVDEGDTLREVIARRHAGETGVVEFEVTVVRPDGSRRRAHVTSSTVIENGELTGTFGMVRDVTDERAAAARLAELSGALEQAVEGIAWLDAEGRIVSANPAYAAAFGRTPEELRCTRWHSLVHPDDHGLAREARERMHRDGRAELLCRGLHANGGVFHAQAMLVARRGGGDDVLGYHCFLRDVTERARAEEEIRFQAHLLQCVQQAVIATDAEGRIIHWNGLAETLYGWSPAEVMGRPIVEILPADEVRAEADATVERLLMGESWRGELRARHRDGATFVAEVVASPVRDAQGRPAGMVCVSHDVTERRRLEDQLRQAQKMEAVGLLAGGVAHDFNNVLTAINGYADLVMGDLPHGSPLRDDVAEIRRAADRAAALTRQLLAFSRRQVLQPRALDVNEVVTSIDKMLRRLITEDVELELRLAPDIGPIWADPGQLDQVLVNLVVNARDAMPRGGRLVIETREAELTPFEVASHPSGLPAGRYVALRVADTGVGMDPATMARIFEPFFTTKAGSGTGLGLASVYGIVQQSGGRVWAESTPGGGTTFHVWLPHAQVRGEGEGHTAEGDDALPRGGGETVLLVEDEVELRSLAGRVLRRYGYNVVDAANGSDAISVAATHPGPIHLLLTDVVMPGMSGAELAARLTHANPELRVLFMSGYPGDALAQHGLDNERLELIAKPFPAERLATRVRQVIDSMAA